MEECSFSLFCKFSVIRRVRRKVFEFWVKDFDTVSYYPQLFRDMSGLNNVSKHCVVNMTTIEIVSSFSHLEFIWNSYALPPQ